jgi:hypothetical protein
MFVERRYRIGALGQASVIEEFAEMGAGHNSRGVGCCGESCQTGRQQSDAISRHCALPELIYDAQRPAVADILSLADQ